MKKFIAFTLVVFLALSNSVCAIGFGAGPADITFDGVLPGSLVTKTIVFGGDDKVPLKVSAAASGDIAQWVSFSGGDLSQDAGGFFELAPGEHTTNAVFNIPQGTKDGVYKGEITFSANPVEAASEGVSVSFSLSVPLAVTARVTSEKTASVEVLGVSLARNQVGDSPVQGDITLHNKGNSAAKAVVKVNVLNEQKTRVLSSKEVLLEVEPQIENRFPLTLTDAGLSPGRYITSFEVSVGDESVWNTIKPFSVNEVAAATTILPTPKVAEEKTLFGKYLWPVVLAAGAAAAYVAHSRKRKR